MTQLSVGCLPENGLFDEQLSAIRAVAFGSRCGATDPFPVESGTWPVAAAGILDAWFLLSAGTDPSRANRAEGAQFSSLAIMKEHAWTLPITQRLG